MLTNNDLQKIGKIIDEKLESNLDEKLEPIRKDLKKLDKRTQKIQKDSSSILDFLNKEDVNLQKRVKKIENQLGLSSN